MTTGRGADRPTQPATTAEKRKKQEKFLEILKDDMSRLWTTVLGATAAGLMLSTVFMVLAKSAFDAGITSHGYIYVGTATLMVLTPPLMVFLSLRRRG